MAARQQHGFNFEDAVKKVLKVKDNKKYTDPWDVGEDTSIKFIRQTGSVDMGSARRIYETSEAKTIWKMVLGRHENKVCLGVYELIFTAEMAALLMGELTTEDIVLYEKAISIKSFPGGQHLAARAFSEQWKKDHKKKTGLLTINPKIGRTNQRRIQCSLNTTSLNKLFTLTSSTKYAELIGVDFG